MFMFKICKSFIGFIRMKALNVEFFNSYYKKTDIKLLQYGKIPRSKNGQINLVLSLARRLNGIMILI